MKQRELRNLGLPRGAPIKLAGRLIKEGIASGLDKERVRARLRAVIGEPRQHTADPYFGPLARELIGQPAGFSPREQPAPWRQWGEDLDEAAVAQLRTACELPVAHCGALMPDAHLGYGLPIGGVLATEGAVIPYAVGVDIACRMRMTVVDMPARSLRDDADALIDALKTETRFGVGASFRRKRDHEVMDADWGATKVTRQQRDKAWAQLGTSGSGNHFVEWGTLTLDRPDLGVAAGTYVALLSHSGSRGAGAAVAQHYSKLAMKQHPELPKAMQHLAWLELDSSSGQEYWAAMSLMGDYAKANHELIHHHILRALRARARATVENHHNFAWRERHGGRDVIVHRKGATPAGRGVLGVIPGSMATPGYVVRGRGAAASLESASHGAGRVLSRKAAKRSLRWPEVKAQLERSGVTLLSADLDEAPSVYKDIEQVMDAQNDLVERVARFEPKIVKMAGPGERPED